MKQFTIAAAISLATLGVLVPANDAAEIAIFREGTRQFDDDLADHLDSRGHNVTFLNLNPVDADEQIAVAEGSDAVYISESVGSANTHDGFETFIKGVDTPVIWAEAYAWDEAALTDVVQFEDFGNTFRVEGATPELEDGQDSIIIVDPNHPLAAGFQGSVQVFEDIYSLNYGFVPTMGSGVDVVATADAAGEYATLFVYEKDAQLADGTPAGGRRIGFFLGQGEGDPQWDNLTDNGIAVIDATFDYALGLLQPGAPALWAGDADQDLDFDQLDLVKVQVAAKYLTGEPATWGEGDWNGAPGGSQGDPPPGNGLFDQLDIISALSPNHYLQGKYATAVAPDGVDSDGQVSVGYSAQTGEVWVDAPSGVELTSINIDSEAGIFVGDPAQSLGSNFDNDTDNNIFKATFGGSFGSISFGDVAEKGLTEQFLLSDLKVVGSLAGGGGLGEVDLIFVPEPNTALLLILGVIGLLSAIRPRAMTPSH